ncbi:MAG TPA: Gfo/Idh/MocA family oxidoreductase [Nitrospirales bacterium]|nr:Gfo/Idh/MocA family oxidoreductase [Nitrospirales bacterium]HIO21044.1 Gfo/Idh/MocA family oxidoreductase [Nitrospirales bacterium]HIO69066.1 Gfo/Idh/MocA family oxidoreductase [Nitrospirales bacterium]
MNRDRIRYGVIGMGRQGERYIRHLRVDTNHADLVAVTRADQRKGEKEAAALGVHWEQTWQTLLQNPAVDAVVICVPCSLHRTIAIAAVETRKHVILEKPLAPTLADGKAIATSVSKAARKGVKLFFAHTLRYSNVVNAITKHQHRIGDLASLNLSQRLEHKPLLWEHKKTTAGGGNIIQTGTHMFDLVRCITQDEITYVSCIHGRVLEKEVEDSFTAIMETRKGIQITLEGSKYGQGRHGRVELIGPKGMLLGDHVGNTLEFVNQNVSRPIKVGEPAMTVIHVLRDATRAFRGKQPLKITVEDGLASLAIAQACYRSAQSKKREKVLY